MRDRTVLLVSLLLVLGCMAFGTGLLWTLQAVL
jgi:hypothetical protein